MSKLCPRKICVVLVDRANYGRMKPVMAAIAGRSDLQLQVIASGTMMLERFGSAVRNVRDDGFTVNEEIYIELEGSTPATMAKSVGIAVVEMAGTFQRLRPDVVLLIGDRYETVAAATAAAYMNLTIGHIQGGEVSGSIDESARHAISKFAHFHFPSTERAAQYLERMGERPDTILTIGCPGSDIARTLNRTLPAWVLSGTGSGAAIDVSHPFLLAIFHPTTTEYGGERAQMQQYLASLHSVGMPCVLLWPNIDAGADHISKTIRQFRDLKRPNWLRTITNLPPETYLQVLANAVCAVGNSSSFARDAGYFGTPVVLVGSRQAGRETDEHVVLSAAVEHEIVAAIRFQLAHGRYPPSALYGDGFVAERIAEALAKLNPYQQKRLHYVQEHASMAIAGR